MPIAVACGRWTSAQSGPDKPIRAFIPFGAGSATDVIPRALFEPLGAEFGQSIIVENRGGAGGTLGIGAVVRAVASWANGLKAKDFLGLGTCEAGVTKVSGSLGTLPGPQRIHDVYDETSPYRRLARARASHGSPFWPIRRYGRPTS